jgi:hypothetical protein
VSSPAGRWSGYRNISPDGVMPANDDRSHYTTCPKARESGRSRTGVSHHTHPREPSLGEAGSVRAHSPSVRLSVSHADARRRGSYARPASRRESPRSSGSAGGGVARRSREAAGTWRWVGVEGTGRPSGRRKASPRPCLGGRAAEGRPPEAARRAAVRWRSRSRARRSGGGPHEHGYSPRRLSAIQRE